MPAEVSEPMVMAPWPPFMMQLRMVRFSQGRFRRMPSPSRPDLIAMQFDTPGLLTDADAAAAVEGLPPASAILLIAWENTWAIRASMALREKGGVLLGFHRIPVTEIDAAMDELEAVILEEVEG